MFQVLGLPGQMPGRLISQLDTVTDLLPDWGAWCWVPFLQLKKWKPCFSTKREPDVNPAAFPGLFAAFQPPAFN